MKSGRHDIVLEKCTTSRPVQSIQTATADTLLLAMTVPIAAPRVPNAGIGPAPLMNTTFKQKLRTVIAIPRRKGVRASPAARSAPPSMKNISRPMLPVNISRRNGSASARTAGVALTSVRSVGRGRNRAAPALQATGPAR